LSKYVERDRFCGLVKVHLTCDRVGKLDREFIGSRVERARDVSDLLLHCAGVHMRHAKRESARGHRDRKTTTARIIVSKPGPDA
jgi:hypothetical protein